MINRFKQVVGECHALAAKLKEAEALALAPPRRRLTYEQQLSSSLANRSRLLDSLSGKLDLATAMWPFARAKALADITAKLPVLGGSGRAGGTLVEKTGDFVESSNNLNDAISLAHPGVLLTRARVAANASSLLQERGEHDVHRTLLFNFHNELERAIARFGMLQEYYSVPDQMSIAHDLNDAHRAFTSQGLPARRIVHGGYHSIEEAARQFHECASFLTEKYLGGGWRPCTADYSGDRRTLDGFYCLALAHNVHIETHFSPDLPLQKSDLRGLYHFYTALNLRNSLLSRVPELVPGNSI